jgi:glucose-6-phosphate 1-dehydrogenase
MPDETLTDAIVLFGATGDLARKKLFPAIFRLEAATDICLPVVGVASSDWSDDELRHRALQGIVDSGINVHDDRWSDLSARMHYCSGDYRAHETYDRLGELLADVHHPLFFLAIPPSLFHEVVEGLSRVGLA